MLFDGYVLKCLYDFAKARDAEVCFCDAVYYEPGEGVHPVGGFPAAPQYPRLFADNAPLKLQQTAFIWGNYVLGATLFMKRENAVRYYELASRGRKVYRGRIQSDVYDAGGDPYLPLSGEGDLV